MDPRTRKLLEAPIGPTLLRLSGPNIVVMVVQASIGLIETYFVAKLGIDALAGMALVFPVLMLFVMISAGAVGGGILSAIARALGAGDREGADALAWHAVAIAVALGLLTSVATLSVGPALYALMGGRGGSLAAAIAYSTVVFIGALPLWLFNSLAAVIRGTGNIHFPAIVVAIGAVLLIPLSPVLIFGIGPFPRLGIAGGATAVVIYYVIGSVVFAYYIWSGRTVLKPSALPPRLSWPRLYEILRVGAVSSAVSVSTNVSIGVVTGLIGQISPNAVAGYGTGARLEYLLVPLVFGLGAPLAAMVGSAIGAGNRERAVRTAWTGAAIAGLLTEAIGLAAALFPHGWLGLFGHDPAMLEVGSYYLRTVGPFYGFFGFGLALYFASQGAGRLGWPALSAILRVLVAALGGWLVVRFGGGLGMLFSVVALALVSFGCINAAAIAAGVWFKPRLIRARVKAQTV